MTVTACGCDGQAAARRTAWPHSDHGKAQQEDKKRHLLSAIDCKGGRGRGAQ